MFSINLQIIQKAIQELALITIFILNDSLIVLSLWNLNQGNLGYCANPQVNLKKGLVSGGNILVLMHVLINVLIVFIYHGPPLHDWNIADTA